MHHPVAYLFEEIYRDYWGIPRPRQDPVNKHRDELAARRRQMQRGESRR
jgi:hypothetical protein